MAEKKATFAMGCFWHPDDYYSKRDGVISTKVGYAGGTTKNPTYENIGDHTESTEIHYDPNKVDYAALLEDFFDQHDPSLKTRPQYRSIIFVHDVEQQKAAEAELKKRQSTANRPLLTQIREAHDFTTAEEYHQKFYAKRRGDVPST